MHSEAGVLTSVLRGLLVTIRMDEGGNNFLFEGADFLCGVSMVR